jgi:signal transduction histidine kinase
MGYSLRSKLTLSYIFIVVIIIGMTSLIANMGIKARFEKYAVQKQEKQTEEIIELIQMKYVQDKALNPSYLEIIGMNALQNGLTIVVKDSKNHTVWSAYEHNNGLCQAMIINMAANMSSYSRQWNGEYQEKNYELVQGNKKLGTLTTGFVGPYYFNDEELIFIKALNSLFVIIGVSSLLVAVGAGIFMSVRISRPLNLVSTKALSLSQGKYKERLKVESTTKEIRILINTINGLSEALEAKDSLRKQLTQDVAHELRTPLTSVQGHMEAMLDGIWDMSAERLSSCYEEIIRIKKLIGRIEDLSGAENENLLLHKEEFDFTKLIIRLLNNYANELLEKDIRVTYTNRENLVYADEDKMSQVFNNLLSNAIKYSKKETQISIEVNYDADIIKIAMRDTGIGIAEEDLPHIFERFYRADKSRNRSTGGVGIGLAITKALIEAHEGSIEVESKLGEGTEFIITLPRGV